MVSATFMLLPLVAKGDAQDTFNFIGGASIRYEDNLFKLESASDARALLGNSQRSDWVYTANAGISIDKLYSQQRFQLEVVASHNHNQTYDFLDFDAVNYRGAWLWHLTPRINGVLSVEQQQTLTSFSDFRGTNLGTPNLHRRNVQTTEVRVFNFDGDAGAGVHLIGGATEIRSRTSQAFNAIGDYVQDGVELGVKYVFPSENYVSLVRRESKGDFNGRVLDVFNQLDTGFDQSETEAKMVWKLTGHSELDAKLDYLERNHDHFSQRDFSGATGNIVYRWTPTAKLLLDVTLAHNLYSFQELSNSYYEADSLTIVPTWLVTAKTKLRLKYDYSNRDFKGAIVPVTRMREDTMQLLLLSADWQATRNILVSGTLQHEDRSSNIPGLDYKANSVGVSAQVLF